MTDVQWSLFLGVGLVFGAIAGLCAYVILYEEYQKHFGNDLSRARMMSLRGALFAFGFFVVLTLAAVYVMPNLLAR